MADQNILDKSMRSVFVGNIPYEATEEKLKDIFNEVGPVLSFKLVYDRETGKPKGYGFCEYKDQETALSAMRNLNGYEISGRTLRVDNACTEKSRLEMQSLMMGMPTSETHYGDAVNAEKAPEIINNIVSSLPPEQLYDLMKQMKECIHNNPVEARNMLLQNPQLGYALLQAQVIMKIVDPEVARSMMYGQHKVPGPIPSPTASTSKVIMPVQHQRPDDHWRTFDPSVAPPPRHSDNMNWLMNTSNHGRGLLPNLSQLPPTFLRPPPFHVPPARPRDYHPLMPDNRPFGNAPFRDLNFINLPPMNVPPPGIVKDQPPPRHVTIPPPPHVTIPPPSHVTIPPPAQNLIAAHSNLSQPSLSQPSSSQPSTSQSSSSQSSPSQSNKAVVSDTEKASLIMQVLQLTDAQISLLPPDQRQSILDLKEKISVSQRKLFLDNLS